MGLSVTQTIPGPLFLPLQKSDVHPFRLCNLLGNELSKFCYIDSSLTDFHNEEFLVKGYFSPRTR